MKMIIGVIVAAAIIYVGLRYNKAKAQSNVAKSESNYDKKAAEDFVKRIDELGYFKYTDSSKLDSLKISIVAGFDPENELTTIWDDNTGVPQDYRYYSCDGESVYEQGGVTDLLKALQPSFDKFGFKCEISAHFEEWDDKNKWLNHRITINGTEYVIFKNFKETGWGEAVKRISEILNEELAKQAKDERIYLASGGNDGRLIFLNKELYEYIYSVYKNPMWKPLELEEWAKVMSVEPMKLD